MTKSLNVMHYLFEQGLLFFRRERTQRRHLTVGGLKPVRMLIAFPFTTDKEPCLNCWEVHRKATGLYWIGKEGTVESGLKKCFAVGLPTCSGAF